MDETHGKSTPSIDRRALIRRAAGAGIVAWTAPVVVGSLASPAAAATCGGPPTFSAFAMNDSQAANSTASATVTLNGNVAGDVLVVGLMIEKGNSVIIAGGSAPAGWTLILRTDQGSNVGMATYYRVITANENTSVTFSLTNGPKWNIGISRWQCVNTTTPLNGTAAGNSAGSGATPTAPSINTVVANAAVLRFFTNQSNATWTPAAGTERYDDPNGPPGSDLPSNMLTTQTQASAGATNTLTATGSPAANWVAQTVALRPV